MYSSDVKMVSNTVNYGSYCSMATFVEAVNTISEVISVVGLPPIPKYDERNPAPTISCLINTVWTLLLHRQNFLEAKHTLEEKIACLTHDIKFSKNKYDKLNNEMVQFEDQLKREKQLTTLKEKEKTNALFLSKCNKQKVQELELQIKNREQRFKFEFKKQQCEIVVLQSQLRKILIKEKGVIWKKPTCSLALKNVDEYENRTSTDKEEYERLLQKSMKRLENNLQTLIKENISLKQSLDDISVELSQIMANRELHKSQTAVDKHIT